MQRQRPRLKQFSITCNLPDCSKPAVRLYPTRPSARSRIHHTYCCPEHGKKHWAQLRRQQLAEEAQPYQCAGPDCTVMIEPAFTPGRRKVYHDDACRERAKTARRRRQPAGDVQQARARVLVAQQRADAAQQEADAHRVAFKQWHDTDYTDVTRRIQRTMERRKAEGKQGRLNWKPAFQERINLVADLEEEGQVRQRDLDRIAEGRAAAADRAADSLRTIEARLARRAANARRRRAQEQQSATVAQEQRDTVTGLTPSETEDLRTRSRAGDMKAAAFLQGKGLR